VMTRFICIWDMLISNFCGETRCLGLYSLPSSSVCSQMLEQYCETRHDHSLSHNLVTGWLKLLIHIIRPLVLIQCRQTVSDTSLSTHYSWTQKLLEFFNRLSNDQQIKQR
jgi:hypothetical protein